MEHKTNNKYFFRLREISHPIRRRQTSTRSSAGRDRKGQHSSQERRHPSYSQTTDDSG